MENPNCWTKLHYELSNILSSHSPNKTESIIALFKDNNIEVDSQKILEIMSLHSKTIEDGLCGGSLEHTLINTFKKILK